MKRLTFETLLDKFKEYLITKNSPERTVEAYTKRIRFFFDFLINERKIDNILLTTKGDIKQYQTHLYYCKTQKGAQYSAVTQYAFISTLSPFFKFLSRNDYIPHNPMLDIEFPKYRRSLPRNIMTKKEIEKILSLPRLKTIAGLRDKAILEVLYSTGIRTGELVNLTLYDIDLQKGFLKIDKGKGQKDRIVPIGKLACKYIKKYLRTARPKIQNSSRTQTLFLTQRGNRFERANFGKIIQKYAELANLKKRICPHSFRHTCATQMLEQGADIRYIQELLGHQSLQTTQIYTRVTIKELKKAHTRFHPRERAG